MLASIQPASVNQSKGDLGIPADSEKRGTLKSKYPIILFDDDRGAAFHKV
jgi:hypothetical protein